jgi:hypothetical protein
MYHFMAIRTVKFFLGVYLALAVVNSVNWHRARCYGNEKV